MTSGPIPTGDSRMTRGSSVLQTPSESWPVTTRNPGVPAEFAPPADADRTFTLRPQDLDHCFRPDENTWYFPRVAGTFQERAGFHGCQMPEQLLGRIIRTCSNPGDVVLDPFSGSATTLAVAKKLGRRFIGFDISKDYVRYGRERLDAIRVGDRLDGSPEPLRVPPAPRPARRRRRAGRVDRNRPHRCRTVLST